MNTQPWPPKTNAYVLKGQISQERYEKPAVYLKAGQVVRVDSDEGDYLIVQDPNSNDLVPLMKQEALQVPPYFMEPAPKPNQALVGNLLGDGYSFAWTGSDEPAPAWLASITLPPYVLANNATAVLFSEAENKYYWTRSDPVTRDSLAFKVQVV